MHMRSPHRASDRITTSTIQNFKMARVWREPTPPTYIGFVARFGRGTIFVWLCLYLGSPEETRRMIAPHRAYEFTIQIPHLIWILPFMAPDGDPESNPTGSDLRPMPRAPSSSNGRIANQGQGLASTGHGLPDSDAVSRSVEMRGATRFLLEALRIRPRFPQCFLDDVEAEGPGIDTCTTMYEGESEANIDPPSRILELEEVEDIRFSRERSEARTAREPGQSYVTDEHYDEHHQSLLVMQGAPPSPSLHSQDTTHQRGVHYVTDETLGDTTISILVMPGYRSLYTDNGITCDRMRNPGLLSVQANEPRDNSVCEASARDAPAEHTDGMNEYHEQNVGGSENTRKVDWELTSKRDSAEALKQEQLPVHDSAIETYNTLLYEAPGADGQVLVEGTGDPQRDMQTRELEGDQGDEPITTSANQPKLVAKNELTENAGVNANDVTVSEEPSVNTPKDTAPKNGWEADVKKNPTAPTQQDEKPPVDDSGIATLSKPLGETAGADGQMKGQDQMKGQVEQDQRA